MLILRRMKMRRGDGKKSVQCPYPPLVVVEQRDYEAGTKINSCKC
jgi:hypothetical protein